MKTKHTKGEWKVREVKAYRPNELVYTRIDSDNKTLGFAGVYCDDKRKISINEAKANAKLIAAAPELLKMLIELEDVISIGIKIQKESGYHWEIKEAIKKATE